MRPLYLSELAELGLYHPKGVTPTLHGSWRRVFWDRWRFGYQRISTFGDMAIYLGPFIYHRYATTLKYGGK